MSLCFQGGVDSEVTWLKVMMLLDAMGLNENTLVPQKETHRSRTKSEEVQYFEVKKRNDSIRFLSSKIKHGQ